MRTTVGKRERSSADCTSRKAPSVASLSLRTIRVVLYFRLGPRTSAKPASSLARLGIARRLLEIRDEIGPLLGVFNAGIGHPGARHRHQGILEKVIECLL